MKLHVFIYLIFIYGHVCVCMPDYMYVYHMHEVPVKVKKGHVISWNWSSRKLYLNTYLPKLEL